MKLVNTKNSETSIDIENKLKKAINYERNRQLNQYSKIYYNKICLVEGVFRIAIVNNKGKVSRLPSIIYNIF